MSAWVPIFIAMALAGPGGGPNEAARPVLTGVWGGDRMMAEFSASGANFEQDCASGEIHAAVRPDGRGRFVADGVYRAHQFGPQREKGSDPPAVFTGEIVGAAMRLTIRPTGGPARSFVLQRGVRVKSIRCY